MSRPQRRLRWGSAPPRPIPKHPYRDTLVIYAVLAAVLLGIALLSGTAFSRAIVIAALVFVASSGWSMLSWRRRLRQAAEQQQGLDG